MTTLKARVLPSLPVAVVGLAPITASYASGILTIGMSGGSVAGNSGELQYNNNGALGAVAGSNWTGSNLTLPAPLTLSGGVSGASPAPRITMGSYFDNAGNPSISHLDLFGGQYGFGISSGQLNYISNAVHAFYAGGVLTAATLLIGANSMLLSGGTVVANTPVFDASQTWNNGSVAFSGIKLNITDSASAAASVLLDLQIGAVSQFKVNKDASISHGAPGTATNKIGFFADANNYSIRVGGFNAQTNFDINGKLEGMTSIGLTGTSGLGNSDVFLARDAAQIFAQRNGTNAQTFRVYNTFTDTSNYERGVFDWTTTANTLTIGSQAAGSGSNRNVRMLVPGSNHFLISINGSDSVDIDGSAGLHVFNFWPVRVPALQINSDTGISRVAAKVASFTDAATDATGWMQWAGQKRVTADFSVTSNTTLANVTGLSATVIAGRTYSFVAELPFTCAAAGGVKAAIAGTATATDIRYNGYIVDSGANGIKGNTQAAALATTVASATTTGTDGVIRIMGTITVNAAGTLTVQFAQNTSSGTASVVKRGAFFLVHDMP